MKFYEFIVVAVVVYRVSICISAYLTSSKTSNLCMLISAHWFKGVLCSVATSHSGRQFGLCFMSGIDGSRTSNPRTRFRLVNRPVDILCVGCEVRLPSIPGQKRFPFCRICCTEACPKKGQTIKVAIHNFGLPGMPGRLSRWEEARSAMVAALDDYGRLLDQGLHHPGGANPGPATDHGRRGRPP